jgi:hypothetical protein
MSMSLLRRWWPALIVALLWLGLAAGAHAQERLRIEAFDVERVSSIDVGTRLNFSLFGPAGGHAVLQIEGARQALVLRELQPGVYDGSHVVGLEDRIAPEARVRASLRVAGEELRAVLDEPLVLDPLGARKPLPIESARRPPAEPVPLPDPLPDPLPPPLEAHAPLPAPAAEPLPRPEPTPLPVPRCEDCAIVESIRTLAVPADDTPRASAPGVLLGTLFGDKVGHAVDRHVARVTGVVQRAVHGRPLDERPAAGQTEVVLRLPTGERLLRTYDRPPALQIGDTVRRGTDLGGARTERLLQAGAGARASAEFIGRRPAPDGRP